jgi:hypothetical protein
VPRNFSLHIIYPAEPTPPPPPLYIYPVYNFYSTQNLQDIIVYVYSERIICIYAELEIQRGGRGVPTHLQAGGDTSAVLRLNIISVIDGHNRRWIDGSIPMVSIGAINRYFWSHFHQCYQSIG